MQRAVIFPDNNAALFSVDDRRIATFDLDHLHQMSTVVLFDEKTSTPEERLAALKLAAHHVRGYVVSRTYFSMGGLLQSTVGTGIRDLQSSHVLLMQARPASDLDDMDFDTLESALKELGVSVIMAVHANYLDALDCAVSEPSLAGTVSYVPVRELTYGNLIQIRLQTTSDQGFTFWSALSAGSNLHIIPSDHPTMKGQYYSALINGDTDYLIRGESVRNIYPPTQLGAPPVELTLAGTWSKVSHPYKLSGQCFEVTIEKRHILSATGVQTLVDLLQDALGMSNSYVGVRGGFNSPYTYPGNIVRQYGIRPEGGVARGSEDHCAWTYYVLQDEGKLDGSIIPAWFHSEGWLNAYPHPSKITASR